MNSQHAAIGQASVKLDKKPKRAALVIHALHGGGAERLMSQLRQSLVSGRSSC